MSNNHKRNYRVSKIQFSRTSTNKTWALDFVKLCLPKSVTTQLQQTEHSACRLSLNRVLILSSSRLNPTSFEVLMAWFELVGWASPLAVCAFNLVFACLLKQINVWVNEMISVKEQTTRGCCSMLKKRLDGQSEQLIC